MRGERREKRGGERGGLRCGVLSCAVDNISTNIWTQFEAFDLPQSFHVFLLHFAVSSTFAGFKLHLFHTSSRRS